MQKDFEFLENLNYCGIIQKHGMRYMKCSTYYKSDKFKLINSVELNRGLILKLLHI